VGLARVALARGDRERARGLLGEALARSPDDPDALLALAGLEQADGAPDRARAALERGLAGSPSRADLHHALAELTGRAPRSPAADTAEALRRAEAHPYDPRARLAAGVALVREGRAAEARPHLRFAVWLSDLDPQAGLAAASLLRRVDDEWRDRRVVPVHVFADETVRREAHWRMRLRMLLRGTTRTLDPFLGTAFVPVSMQPFASDGAAADLDSIARAFGAAARPRPPHGILAAFSERPPPHRRETRLGEAEFLGRSLVVRLEPGALSSPTLVHEMLHLYGAVHVSDDVDSLMNSTANRATLVIDPLNLRIVRATRGRHFDEGGIEANVLPFVDVDETSAAYADALRLNLAFRRLGLEQALSERRTSAVAGAVRAQEAFALDSHLADVSRFVAMLYARQGRGEEAAHLLDVAAALYGPNSAEGRDAGERARRLRAVSPSPSDPGAATR
jgi:tetratricopeptide (TPR) repeat protein